MITPETLKSHINQCREFADVIDEEGMDRDGLHFAIYAVIQAAESTLALKSKCGCVHCGVALEKQKDCTMCINSENAKVMKLSKALDVAVKALQLIVRKTADQKSHAVARESLTQISALRGKGGS